MESSCNEAVIGQQKQGGTDGHMAAVLSAHLYLCRRCSSCNTDITEDLYSRHKVRCVYEEFMREKAKKEALRHIVKKNQ
ncbi:hypothetical protein CKK34_2240 [Yarrowia sp. E02]|nr:hypothetical protein CKK34_2240 [Yarrowia sp. E02]